MKRGPKKGARNNPAGRPAGVPNKLTAELRSKISDFLDENWEKIKNDFASLESKDRVMLFEKFLQYMLPRLQSNNISLEPFDPESAQQLKDEIERRKKLLQD